MNRKKAGFRLFLAVYFVSVFLFLPICSLAGHGLSIDGTLKYPADFTHFEYTDPAAVKGGELALHALGSFDKMNPFTLKGAAPFGLESFVFETLAVASLDEPFAKYGLIASAIEVAADKLSVTFSINSNARFSDGSPVKVTDIKYSLDTFKSEEAHPFYQVYFQDIVDAQILDDERIRFNFKKVNKELPLIAGQLPILNQKFYDQIGFSAPSGSDVFLPPVGSGPYIVSTVNPGKSITYTRNKEYWAKNHPVRKNMFNFERITIKYFKDQVVAVEALKAGDFDFMSINIAKQWARDLRGRRFDTGELIKMEFPHNNNAGMQGFVFNTRRDIFADPLVRRAIGLAFDFEWTNQALFFNQYTRANSFFSNSPLAATGIPEGKELELLEQFRSEIPAEVFTTPLTPPVTTPPASLRTNLRLAKKLLKEAGWTVQQGGLVNEKGEEFKFEILLTGPSFARVMTPFIRNLERLGIQVRQRTIDSALYMKRIKKFDFDMIVNTFSQSQSPGNEQRNFWSSQFADPKGSRNMAGIKNPVVDRLVDKIIYAKNKEELTLAVHALDRILWYEYLVVPNWYLSSHRLVFHSKFSQPQQLPRYYHPWQLLDTWWIPESR
jgi:microcin C transport system substrate-binding protein